MAGNYRAQFSCYTISSISATEVAKGLQKLGGEDRIAALITGLAGEEILPLDLAAAVLAGRIYLWRS